VNPRSADNIRLWQPVEGPAGLERADLMDRWAEVEPVIMFGNSLVCSLCHCQILPRRPYRHFQRYATHEECFQHWSEVLDQIYKDSR
jgi:hypothetical protein